MEQCAAGVPIAGTPTRGIVDEVRDGRALSADDSPASVAELIVRLAGDAKLRADLAHAQLAYAHKHFALGLILDKYLALYHSEPTGMDALA
jgi:glycosyltransferase involved in cell wall biosynthesis